MFFVVCFCFPRTNRMIHRNKRNRLVKFQLWPNCNFDRFRTSIHRDMNQLNTSYQYINKMHCIYYFEKVNQETRLYTA